MELHKIRRFYRIDGPLQARFAKNMCTYFCILPTRKWLRWQWQVKGVVLETKTFVGGYLMFCSLSQQLPFSRDYHFLQVF